jgi:uncharacterized protein with von Willebrand factor type A (vWA) domain
VNQPKYSIGGIIHSYLKYDPVRFPGPTQPPPDLISPMMNQMLAYGSMRELTEEELAKAIRLSPEQFQNLGPGLDMIREILEERKRRILETYESKTVQLLAKKIFHKKAKQAPAMPPQWRSAYKTAVDQEQLYDLELLTDHINDDTSPVVQHIYGLMGRLEDKYQIDELVAKYEFTGFESMTIPKALEIKEELEKIDELLQQIKDAKDSAQIAIIDLEQLGEFMDEATMHSLEEMQRMIENYVKEAAERQGLSKQDGRYQLTPQAYRIFQSKLLARIFDQLKASKTGRHEPTAIGEGAVELQATKPYEFGDSLTQMDLPQSLINAMVRSAGEAQDQLISEQGDDYLQPTSPVSLRLKSEDIEIHRTRNRPKSATVIVMDMSGSMRYDGQYINVKRMAMAMEALIRSEYPGDYLGFVEMYTFGKIRRPGEILEMMPRPVTLFDPWVQLKVDMSRPEVSEHMVHQHFTNIQHALRLSRQLLSAQDTLNRQVILITDGLPTAHFEDSILYMVYPPHSRTEEMTLREGVLCAQQGITINTFLVPSWSQSQEDIRFAHKLSEQTKGRVFFTAGKDLDRYVVWDYLNRKREILG